MSLNVSIFACGGCGINLVRALDLKGIRITRIDTSRANVNEGEEVLVIGDGDGSGKNRASNAEKIQKYLTSIQDLDQMASGLNLVLFSLGGGSGSICAPVIVRELEKRGLKTVAVCVGDTGSERELENTLNTLKTLSAVTSNNNIYLPTMLFDNSKVGRSVVDKSVTKAIRKLITMAREETKELDTADRMNFFNAPKVVASATPGIKPLIIRTGNESYLEPLDGAVELIEEDDILDTAMIIAAKGEGENAQPVRKEFPFQSRVVFDGMFEHIQKTPYVACIQSHDGAIKGLLDLIQQRAANFKSQGARASVLSFDNTGGDDLIL